MEQQRQQIEKRLEATMLLRKQIETLPSNTPKDIERKTKMLETVDDQTKPCEVCRRHAPGGKLGSGVRTRNERPPLIDVG